MKTKRIDMMGALTACLNSVDKNNQEEGEKCVEDNLNKLERHNEISYRCKVTPDEEGVHLLGMKFKGRDFEEKSRACESSNMKQSKKDISERITKDIMEALVEEEIEFQRLISRRLGSREGCEKGNENVMKGGCSPLGETPDKNRDDIVELCYDDDTLSWEEPEDVNPPRNNLFFWSDLYAEFDGQPDYKVIVDPKYDAILVKCTVAPAEWQVPDLGLPMSGMEDRYSCDFSATSYQFSPSTSVDLQSDPSAGAGSHDDPQKLQRVFLKDVNVTFQKAVPIRWQETLCQEYEIRSNNTESVLSWSPIKTSTDLVVYDDFVDELELFEKSSTPWVLPEDEAKALRVASLRYLAQFGYSPPPCRLVSSGSSYCALGHSRKIGEAHAPRDQPIRTHNPDIEFFRQQLAPLLQEVTSDDTSDLENEENAEYYPDLLEIHLSKT